MYLSAICRHDSLECRQALTEASEADRFSGLKAPEPSSDIGRGLRAEKNPMPTQAEPKVMAKTIRSDFAQVADGLTHYLRRKDWEYLIRSLVFCGVITRRPALGCMLVGDFACSTLTGSFENRAGSFDVSRTFEDPPYDILGLSWKLFNDFTHPGNIAVRHNM